MVVKTHKFNGRVYHIHFGKCDGTTDQKSPPYDMLIMAKPFTYNELITLIHEAMHAVNWDAKESKVEKASNDIGRFLWRLGYRRENDQKGTSG